MDDPVFNNGIPGILGVELSLTAQTEQLLSLLQGELQCKAQTEQPVSGGGTAAGENLVEIDLAEACALGKAGFGDPLFPAQLRDALLHFLAKCLSFVLMKELIQRRRLQQRLMQIVRISSIQCDTTFTLSDSWYII